MAAQQPARASPELRKAPLSPRYLQNYTTPRGTTSPSSGCATMIPQAFIRKRCRRIERPAPLPVLPTGKR